ncbi:MAG TPA: DNA polymerase III subunit delta [Solirubrobacteraceae bacterium]|jgi:DNA polymerase-3 subunit delta|nr:DNA polymerase III subunit delta [Solirubrobacteraceae bacterium]
MADLKPAYLIHGDDHGAVAERRAGLRALAESEDGSDSVESLEGESATPEGVAGALAAMTLTVGRRVILVDGVERWKQAEVEQRLAPALAAMAPDTTVALFAREESRTKAPAAVHEAVKRAGGQVVAQATVKPWDLPKWARAQAARMGIELDMAAAAALVGQVGERQQRLLRELEKLALELDGPGRVTVEEIEARAAHSVQYRAYTLADALVGGSPREATRVYVRLREQGERLAGLTYLMASRLRDALAVALRLGAGESPAEVRRGLRMPPRAAERFVRDVAQTDPERLRSALATLADLELDTRGGSPLPDARSRMSGLDEETLALRAIETITDGR